MVFLQERIGKLVSELERLIYPFSEKIEHYKIRRTETRFPDLVNLDTSTWEDFSEHQLWGGHRAYYWFETTVTIPEKMNGQCVVYDLLTGQEGGWDATNPQFLIYVNGKPVQGLDINHRGILLTENAKKGETFRILLSAFTGDQNFSLKLDSWIRILDRRTEKYYYDILVPYQVSLLLDSQEKAYIDIIQSLNESLNLLDLRKEYSPAYYTSLEQAQENITKEFYGKRCGESEAMVYCVGHTHIDVAWLWTLAVTEDKAVRSFSTVLELMRRYPEYLFMSSQPQLYQYVKRNAPDIYKQIKERVAEGRWEVNGGMWVEADCNIASGEALVRQFVYGQRFFQKEFKKDNDILWLPDVFGYSAALPQIMQKCGLPYFMTTKISWNEFNTMPYDTFEWEGIDGTKVLTHFIPAQEYNMHIEPGAQQTEHCTTYNGMINASQIKGSWKRYQQKHLNQEVLMAFGYGDGGGGPTKEMLEHQRRLAKGIPGCPKTKQSTARDFFAELDKNVRKNKYLPTWSGELYLEYHRGTYTSMARNKKFNRQSEFAALNTEFLAYTDQYLNKSSYPQEAINEQWEVILRNQFHDILPGSSIKEVYDDSKQEYETLLAELDVLKTVATNHITAEIDVPVNSVIVYNPNSFPASDTVTFPVPEGYIHPSVYDGDRKLDTQIAGKDSILFYAEDIPAKGYKAFTLQEGAPEERGIEISSNRISNRFFDIRINEKGQFSSIYDKTARREILKDGACGNVLMTYEDKPHNYDAWDINNYYTEKSWEVDMVQGIQVEENGPVSATVRITRKYLDSTIVQYVTVYHDIPKIDIRHEIDWKEKQVLLKSLFPVDIHTNEATFDIQYGNVTRPTHSNTSWDFARFEVCYHKWMDLSEDNYGVSFLNDCKYGCSVHDGVVGLSLLKSAVYPNPEADKEFHTFTFSIYPHSGSWKDAQTVQQAYLLNNPLTCDIKTSGKGTLPAEFSLVSVDSENVIIEAVKKAEDSNDMIVRLYECYNRRTPDAVLTFHGEILKAQECDMMENDESTLKPRDNKLTVSMRPYEIKTLKISLKD